MHMICFCFYDGYYLSCSLLLSFDVFITVFTDFIVSIEFFSGGCDYKAIEWLFVIVMLITVVFVMLLFTLLMTASISSNLINLHYHQSESYFSHVYFNRDFHHHFYWSNCLKKCKIFISSQIYHQYIYSKAY